MAAAGVGDSPGAVRWARTAADFVRSAEGHHASAGLLGATMITLGGFGAGATRVHDPLMEGLHLSWLRFGHGYVLSTILVWIGVVLMVASWVRLGRSMIGERSGVGVNEVRVIVGAWSLPLVFAVPLFSRDAYSYLAQGALLRDGFDPYAVGPVANPGVLLDNVSQVWTTTTAPYGPIFLLLGRAVTSITGDSVVAGVIAMRLAMVPGLVLMVWAVPYLTKHLGGRPTVALWLGVLNPLVLIHLFGGVHNEMLMVGLMCAAVALVLERRHVAGIVVLAIGVAVKATAGVALPFLVWIWLLHERERRAGGDAEDQPHPVRMFARIGGSAVGVFGVVFAGATAIAGVGLGWVTALSGSKKIIQLLSLPTVIRDVITWVTPLDPGALLDPIRGLCMVVLAAVLVWAWWRFRHSEREAVQGIVIAFAGIVVLSPAALPWYYSWPLALAAGFALSTTTLSVLVGLCTWLMLVFDPDGNHGLYNFWHVAAATFVAWVAACSLNRVDPLRLRSATSALD
ncbi:alpha-(1-_6)-mannopyranosyltransferase A [Nocardia huaxiensis]|nr:alpha-(1->6)-mannopyranosyltransferase A [Nocardia huaxiensis]UFS99915.1 alpha-(1->6)-mannopyranosyltransferase A [Nocardia huaxiensis]